MSSNRINEGEVVAAPLKLDTALKCDTLLSIIMLLIIKVTSYWQTITILLCTILSGYQLSSFAYKLKRRRIGLYVVNSEYVRKKMRLNRRYQLSNLKKGCTKDVYHSRAISLTGLELERDGFAKPRL